MLFSESSLAPKGIRTQNRHFPRFPYGPGKEVTAI